MASFELCLRGPAGLPHLPDPDVDDVPALLVDPDAFAVVEERAHYFHDLRCITVRRLQYRGFQGHPLTVSRFLRFTFRHSPPRVKHAQVDFRDGYTWKWTVTSASDRPWAEGKLWRHNFEGGMWCAPFLGRILQFEYHLSDLTRHFFEAASQRA